MKISYRINAFRNERLVQYYNMMRYLKKLGFQRSAEEVVPDTEPEDVAHLRISGTIPSRNARDLLSDRHIRSIQLIPHGAKLPEDKATRVRVEIELASGLPPERAASSSPGRRLKCWPDCIFLRRSATTIAVIRGYSVRCP